jgi:hypothetical protein
MFLMANRASFGRLGSRQLIHTANTARFGSHEWFIKCEMFPYAGD